MAPVKSNFDFAGNQEVMFQTISAIVTRDVAAVKLGCFVGGLTFNTVGTSKRSPEDIPDDNIALGLAYSRALTKAVKKIERQAEGQMVHNEKRLANNKKGKKKK